MNYADVVLPLPIDKTFTYSIPQKFKIPLLARVVVPFGRREAVGWVIRLHDHLPSVKIKPITDLLDPEPLIAPLYFEWLKWASYYYMAPLGEVLQTAFPTTLQKKIHQDRIAQKKIRHHPLTDHWTIVKEVSLNGEQLKILDSLKALTKKSQFAPSLLHGITGSGKTEIYLRLIEEILSEKREVIFLVPEIGLTPQIIARFRHFFGDRLGLYHSNLTPNQRLREWNKARNGQSSVVVGTRSALFMPFKNLGAIILDEEHDSSYKQEERFCYHARDLALLRGKMESCIVLLGSATPCLESLQKGREGRYHYFRLNRRAQGAQTPTIQLIDMAAQKRQGRSPLALCEELRGAIQENLSKREQTLILINRRGFARSLFCLDCLRSDTCPLCSVNRVYHQREKCLLCHYCDGSAPLAKLCGSCGSQRLTLIGEGTETIEHELRSLFSEARIERLDRDTVQKRGVLIKTLKAFREGQIDILVGTQLIAKGHDLPRVTLVGVVGIDSGLGVPDFRASERTFQLMMQVAGRSGRGSLPGRVIVQSFTPGHYSIQKACSGDGEGFYNMELNNRREVGYPPSGRIIQFCFSSLHASRIQQLMNRLKEQFSPRFFGDEFSGVHLLGPSPAPIEKLRGRLRWQLLLKGAKYALNRKAASAIQAWMQSQTNSGVKWSIDVDPINMV